MTWRSMPLRLIGPDAQAFAEAISGSDEEGIDGLWDVIFYLGSG